MPLRLDDRAPGFAAAFAGLVGQKRAAAVDVRGDVETIIAHVVAAGDGAVLEYTRRFDRHDPGPAGLRIAGDEIARAVQRCPAALRAALELAQSRIEAFHRRQLPDDREFTDAQGVRQGLRWRPLDAVGIYVPGGTAAYPSSVLMNAIPAKIAGVERIVMCVPTPDGALHPLVLVAAALAGVDEIYRIGGAQAVAALAYGTASVAAVDKIVGPGNAYVAEAKRQVFGQVGIDLIAGPSEILVVADHDQDPDWIAADLLSQAEHDELAQAILITDGRALADAVAAAVEAQLAQLPRAAVAGPSWRDYGALITLADLATAPALVDRLAPEHLELLGPRAEALAPQIRHAGSMFIGAHTPEVIGDYVGGPNHVLPTGRTARFASGLSVYDFLKRTTFLACPAAALRELGPAAVQIAQAEGLDGHARALARRLDKLGRS